MSFNAGAMISGHSFESDLGRDSFGSGEGLLVFNVNKAGGGITKDGTATELVDLVFPSGSVRETTSDTRVELVHKDQLSWAKLILLWPAILESIFAGMGSTGRSA